MRAIVARLPLLVGVLATHLARIALLVAAAVALVALALVALPAADASRAGGAGVEIPPVASGATNYYGCRELLNVDLSGLPSSDWEGLSSVTLDGFSMPIAESGDWTDTKLGPDGTTGVRVDPSSDANSYFWFEPTIAGLASHYSLTTTTDDRWTAVLSFSLTASENVSVVEASVGEDPLGHWGRIIYGRISGADQFRVDNNQTGSPSAVTISNVSTIGIQTLPNGMGALARYSTSETRSWSDLTPKGLVLPGDLVGPVREDSDGEDSAWTLAKLNRVGAEFSAGQPGEVTLTGLAISHCSAEFN